MESNLFAAYTALGTMAVVPIYYGSFASVRWPKKKKTKPESSGHGAESSSEEESSTESLSTEDAYLFPIIGSVVLFSLYLVFKLLDKDYVNYLITGYFSVLGVIAITNVGVYMVKNVIGLKVDSYRIRLTKRAEEKYRINFTIIHIVMFFVSLLLTGAYVMTKNWIVSNAFGLAFAFNAIQMLSLDSFKTGMVLLSGLFFYDIFWVFGTEVMVTVAKSFDAPIKVVWPKQWFGLQPDQAIQFTMLGLGDIVIPGIYVALCLRFDHSLHLKRDPTAKRYSKFSTPYFTSCFTSYILGLVLTIVVMHTFKAAQPALLYLSPACILSVLLTGLFKNQIREIFTYSADNDKDEGKEINKGDDDYVKKEKLSGEDDEAERDELQTVRKRVVNKNNTDDDDDDDADDDDGYDVEVSTFTTSTTEATIKTEEDYVEVPLSKNKKSKRKKSKRK